LTNILFLDRGDPRVLKGSTLSHLPLRREQIAFGWLLKQLFYKQPDALLILL